MMKPLDKFLEQNCIKDKRWKLKYVTNNKNAIAVLCSTPEQGNPEMRKLLNDIYRTLKVRSYHQHWKDFCIQIPRFAPNDKLVYILLECIVYLLMNKYNYNVQFYMDKYRMNINTRGLLKSPLFTLAHEDMSVEEYNARFRFAIDTTHFRRFIKKEESDELTPSFLLGEVRTFLLCSNISHEFRETMACTVAELVDNSLEHAKADCLVDIDISEDTIMDDDGIEKLYYAINVTVLNFAEMNLGDELEEKIKNRYYTQSEKYDTVSEAYKNHSRFFNKQYTEKSFFSLSTFQQEISGRRGETQTGGHGLADLICTLEEYADEDFCYALTGNQIIFFKKEYLNFNSQNWLGFNHSGDYVNDIPDKSVINRSDTYLPGTGYNFLFAFQGEQNGTTD